MRTEEFLEITTAPPGKSIIKYGRIAPGYTSGRPYVVFDGETAPSGKRYPYLGSYTPVSGDRVMLIVDAGSHVIIGKVI